VELDEFKRANAMHSKIDRMQQSQYR
jgi:hypothetical protein